MLITFAFALLLGGCQSTDNEYPSAYEASPAPTPEQLRLPLADGTKSISDGTYVKIDYSHMQDGYINAKRLDESDDKIKLMIEKDDKKYHYDILPGSDDTFPLQMGDGDYEIRILKQVEGETYARLVTQQLSVALTDSLSPFLYPNQIVDYDEQSEAIALAFDLVQGDTTKLQRIAHLYEYVVSNIVYDHEKADAVANAFVLPVIDDTLEQKKGICFDYAALLAAMLRSQDIPARLVTGYTDIEYHAWVEIYLDGEGWINPKVYFAQESWSRMDPTFAASNSDYEGKYEEVYIY